VIGNRLGGALIGGCVVLRRSPERETETGAEFELNTVIEAAIEIESESESGKVVERKSG